MLSVSQAAAKVVKRDYGIVSEVVPNVVDYDRFNKASAKYPKNVVNIIFLGRLVKRKNPITLLKAINYLIENKLVDIRFKVYICGSGENEQNLKDYVDSHGLENVIDFIGFVNETEKPRVYKSADICVFPSTGGESFGIVLIEAMASGMSVVLAGANPGYSSVLSNFPELLFKPTDYIQLANLLKIYIENENTRKVIAKALNEYSKSFDVNIVGNYILELYRTALRKHTKV
ncbi:MAG TPA: glycosyltransferase family 4 protein [Patescibacteria group bacterium]|nr:glycosyltransferase family 4 protein [Patescibacteria group bacterium]